MGCKSIDFYQKSKRFEYRLNLLTMTHSFFVIKKTDPNVKIVYSICKQKAVALVNQRNLVL